MNTAAVLIGWRLEWRVRHGELAVHRRFLWWELDQSFTHARLVVASYLDEGKSSTYYTLAVIDASQQRGIAHEIGDHTGIVELGRWLSERTGFPLTLPDELSHLPPRPAAGVQILDGAIGVADDDPARGVDQQ